MERQSRDEKKHINTKDVVGLLLEEVDSTMSMVKELSSRVASRLLAGC